VKNRYYPIEEEEFKKAIEVEIIEQRSKRGRPMKISYYQFFCAVFYVLRTGIAWRDVPTFYGNWHTIYMRFKRWSDNGFF
jgi:transposase